jgi:hypothetical protein
VVQRTVQAGETVAAGTNAPAGAQPPLVLSTIHESTLDLLPPSSEPVRPRPVGHAVPVKPGELF